MTKKETFERQDYERVIAKAFNRNLNTNNSSKLLLVFLLYIKLKLKTNKKEELLNNWNEIHKNNDYEKIYKDITDTISIFLKNETTDVVYSVLNEIKKEHLQSSNGWIDLFDFILNNDYIFDDNYISDNFFGNLTDKYYFSSIDKRHTYYTPKYIAEFMCKITDVDKNTVVFDGNYDVGCFLNAAMFNKDKNKRTDKVYGINNDSDFEFLYRMNLLLSNKKIDKIKKANIYESKEFIKEVDPDVVLMNFPYKSSADNIPQEYKKSWNYKGKFDPTKGLISIRYIADIINELNEEKIKNNIKPKEVKLAVILSTLSLNNEKTPAIIDTKTKLLQNNTLEAVLTLSTDNLYYPFKTYPSCILLFTIGKPHPENYKTVFGNMENDGHKYQKNVGRVELLDNDKKPLWESIESQWLDILKNKTTIEGLSYTKTITPTDPWQNKPEKPFEIYKEDFNETIFNYLMFKDGIDPKEFMEKLGEDIAYSSHIIDNGDSITISIPKEDGQIDINFKKKKDEK